MTKRAHEIARGGLSSSMVVGRASLMPTAWPSRVLPRNGPPLSERSDAARRAVLTAITALGDGPYTITAGRLWDDALLYTYRRARAQVVDAVAAGLRDAGLTDDATIERLTEAVVKRLGEG